MIVPRSPDARRPGPSGPDRSSPTGGSFRRAALASKEALQQLPLNLLTNRLWTIRGGQPHSLGGVRRRAQAMGAHVRDCCSLPRRSGGRGRCRGARLTCGACACETGGRSPRATSSSPRPNAGVRAMASRGRVSPGACTSNSPSTRSAAISSPHSHDSPFDSV